MALDQTPPDTPSVLTPEDPRVRQVELVISTLLRIGVTVSLAVVTVGTVLSFVHHGEYRRSKEALHTLTEPPAQFPKTLHEVGAGLGKFSGQSIVALGLILLVATPIVRVGVSIVTFAYEGDRTFLIITTVVLGLLLLSFLLGKAGG